MKPLVPLALGALLTTTSASAALAATTDPPAVVAATLACEPGAHLSTRPIPGWVRIIGSAFYCHPPVPTTTAPTPPPAVVTGYVVRAEPVQIVEPQIATAVYITPDHGVIVRTGGSHRGWVR